jgi:RNA polymerase sigma-70 factor (ECF subfamily)
MTEAEMIARVLAGEKEVFHDLIRPHEKLVYLTSVSILKDESEAEDNTQEAIISAYRHLASFRADARFSTWLVTIAVNGARQRLRSKKRAVLESIDDRPEGDGGDFTPAFLTDWREIPLEALERKEVREAIAAAVKDLPDIYREVFVLRDLEELNVQETAEALGITANVVKVRLHRARMLLQKRLVPFLKTTAPSRRGFFGRRP